MNEKPRIRVPAVSQKWAAEYGPNDPSGAFRPFGPVGSAASFEGAGYGRRLSNFVPAQVHVNQAIQFAGRTLVKRARYMVENNGYAGNAVDVDVAWLVGSGIRPRVTGSTPERRAALGKVFKRWIKEADADGQTNYYGLQEKIAREAYTAGECFVRRRRRRTGDMKSGVPIQLQVLPSEMLDLTYNLNGLESGNIIRLGIEFDKIGRRVAYHFWRYHPDDAVFRTNVDNLRTRVPAEDVLHVFEGRQGGQIRGVPKFARAMVKLFTADMYDDAELERKKTAALYAGFVKKNGEGTPVDNDDEDSQGDIDDPFALEPGAMVILNEGEDVAFSSPADVGGSYEPFQYRTMLQVSVALGVPYAYLTGDTTRGNFSNVRTEIVNYRRKLVQRQQNGFIPQFCEPSWLWFVEAAQDSGKIEADEDYADADWLPPKMEWVDPRVDVAAERDAVRSGFKSRGSVIASLGEDREEVDKEFLVENEASDAAGFVFDTDPRRVSAVGQTNAVPTGSGYADPDDELPDPQEVQDSADEVAKKQADKPAAAPKPAAPKKGPKK